MMGPSFSHFMVATLLPCLPLAYSSSSNIPPLE